MRDAGSVENVMCECKHRIAIAALEAVGKELFASLQSKPALMKLGAAIAPPNVAKHDDPNLDCDECRKQGAIRLTCNHTMCSNCIISY